MGHDDVPVPSLDWNAKDLATQFKQFKKRCNFWLLDKDVKKEKHYIKIIQLLGEEGMDRWDSFNLTEAQQQNPETVWAAFEKSITNSLTRWNYRDEVLANFKQSPDETIDKFNVRLTNILKLCDYKDCCKDQ